jgi:hypothetical protein
VDELKAEFASIEEAAAAVLELFTQTQATLATKAEELAEMKAAYDQMQTDTNTIRTVEVCVLWTRVCSCRACEPLVCDFTCLCSLALRAKRGRAETEIESSVYIRDPLETNDQG